MKCMNYGVVSSKWSLPHVHGAQQVNPFAVNVLATRAMQATGNRQTALNDVFSMTNISRRGLHTKTWQSYVEGKLAPVADCAARNLTSLYGRFANCTQSCASATPETSQFRTMDHG